jgi:flagellar motor protein MotB
VALLNEQVAALRTQLGSLQGLLDDAAERDEEAQVQIQALGTQLNTALAQLAAEQSALADSETARAELEAAEAARLAAEAQELERYRSEFFGRLRELLEGREGVRIDGDRFVFSSEVLFDVGSADLAPEGLAQIENVAALLSEVADDIPDNIDWIIRVDGHTDDQQIGAGGAFANNWELSQARALSVVLYMSEELGIPPSRLAATGFGEFRPVASERDAGGPGAEPADRAEADGAVRCAIIRTNNRRRRAGIRSRPLPPEQDGHGDRGDEEHADIADDADVAQVHVSRHRARQTGQRQEARDHQKPARGRRQPAAGERSARRRARSAKKMSQATMSSA